MAVLDGSSERELDHIGLAYDDTEVAAQSRHQRAVPFLLSRQPAARPGETGIPGNGEQVLDRNGRALQGTARKPRGKGRVGRPSDRAGLVRRP